ncbi:hypothetical protein C4K04_2969 [Pseudomonas chlororaphis]|uniref:Uncharacterized protein n=1 Tax=Pseudomonas chlororaphis TaxID=587753 RepID=A0A3G7TP77_9PSED|nr:hypothetical protein C4K04_2969 [Pseudomonas chlororaphis]
MQAYVARGHADTLRYTVAWQQDSDVPFPSSGLRKARGKSGLCPGLPWRRYASGRAGRTRGPVA